MGFTLIGTWNCLCKAIVLPHIGITWGLHGSTHETAHINHCLATHWYYMGLTLVGSWNCTRKAIVCPHIGIAWGLHWLTETAHVKTLYCHILNYMVPRWSANGVAHVKPLFCHSLVLHGAHISWPMKLPMLRHCFAKHWHYMGFTLLAKETAHV